MKYQKLSIVIPAYNEERTLEQLLAKLEAVNFGLETETILIDDGSKDRTREILTNKYKNKKGYKVLFNEKNMGKSQTVRRGIMESTGDLVVIQDADLEYDPAELVAFVEKFNSTNVDVIYGNRFGKANEVVYWQNWIGNTFLSILSGLITGLRSGMWTRDMEVCYKMAKGDVFRAIGKTIEATSRFGLEPEITAKFSKYKLEGRHLTFAQIPISYYPRTLEEGKKMSAVSDGIKALKEILYFNFVK